MVELAITLGLIFSLLSYEVFGLAAGGIVVPGDIALQLSQPDRLVGIILVSLSTFLIIKILGNYTLLACMVERHLTLDRAMWGSDQAASVEPSGFERLVKYIRS